MEDHDITMRNTANGAPTRRAASPSANLFVTKLCNFLNVCATNTTFYYIDNLTEYGNFVAIS